MKVISRDVAVMANVRYEYEDGFRRMNNSKSLKNDSVRIFDVSFTPFRNHARKGVIGCGFG